MIEGSNPTGKFCGQCGAPLPADAPQGICPACELQGALGMLDAGSEATKIGVPSAEDATPSPPRQFGNYELLEEIARGGMGVVYKARQRGLDRIVAVKMILAERFGGKESVQRFRGEAAAAGLLQHPNIVAIHEIGMHQRQHFFSMDYVEGQNLAQLVGHRPLPALKAARYVQLIAEAVHYAHEQGILHRDLKPSNILIDAITDQPRITDFGLAKRLASDSSLTLSGQVLGSPSFMPPEQASRDRGKVGRPSDVFGLGGILYFLLTARAPFQGESLEATIHQVLNTEPVSPRLLNPSLPRDLETICLKCLEKEPARRYATAQELADELGRFLANKPIRARAVSRPEKVWRWCRRNPVVATLATATVVIFLLGFVGVTWQGQRASKARDLAQGRLYESLVREARATRMVRRVGYRDEVFTLLQQARALDVPQKDFAELGREAVACLGDFLGFKPITFSGFPSNTIVGDVSLDPSGRLAAFGLKDGSLVLRQMPSGAEVARLPMDYHPQSFCFNAAGDQIASVHWSLGTAPIKEMIRRTVVCVWGRTADGRWREIERTPWPRAYGCLTSGGQFFVAVDDPVTPAVKFVELRSKTTVLSVPLPRDKQLVAPAFLSPDGKLLVVETPEPTDSSKTVLDIWDWATGRRVQHLEPGVAGSSKVTFSPDGKYFACDSELKVVIYEMNGFQRVSELHETFTLGARPGFAPWGNLIALPIYQQSRVRLWDFLRNQELAVFEERPFTRAIEFAPDGSFFLTVGGTNARLYRLNLAPEVLRLSGHLGGTPGVCFSPDGSRLASAGKDRTVRVWDAANGRMVWEAKDLPGPGQCVTYSPDGRWLVTTTWDFETCLARVWDARTGKLLLKLGTKVNGSTWSAQFSPDGRHLAIANNSLANVSYDPDSSCLTVWAIESRNTEQPEAGFSANLVRSLPGRFWNLAFAPDSRTVAFTRRAPGCDLLVWDIGGASEPRRIATNLVGSAQSMSFSPDGRQVWTCSADGSALAVDVTTGARAASLSAIGSGGTASPDGAKYASVRASALGVDLWDLKAGRLLYALPDQEGTVWCLAWSPDSRRLAIARSNGDIAVWNLNEVERVLAKLGLDAGVSPVARKPAQRP